MGEQTYEPTYRVKEVAQLSGVTVRTLHHYDAIGLLCPRQRSASGYRLYGDAELLRLQQIVVYRELGLPLEQIRAVFDDANFDPRVALQEQRARLQTRLQHTHAMIRALDTALRTLHGETTMTAQDRFAGFDPTQYEAEAEGRWGHTDAFDESTRRTKGYTQADWARIRFESDALMVQIAAVAAAGIEATDERAMDLAETHRLQIDRFYYACSHAMHCDLALMYTADARFEANLDKYGEGVAAFLAAAIAANAARDES